MLLWPLLYLLPGKIYINIDHIMTTLHNAGYHQCSQVLLLVTLPPRNYNYLPKKIFL